MNNTVYVLRTEDNLGHQARIYAAKLSVHNRQTLKTKRITVQNELNGRKAAYSYYINSGKWDRVPMAARAVATIQWRLDAIDVQLSGYDADEDAALCRVATQMLATRLLSASIG